MDIKSDDLTGPQIISLLQRHLDEMRAATPPESVHALDLDGLRQPEITFWSVWDGDQLRGCGALKELDKGHGEIKSMHVHSDARGKGVAEKMLGHILKTARQRGYTRLSLETGSMKEFLPARKLYEKYGFARCPVFGDYKPDANSICMTRPL
jgi:putative acetyltransferase